MKKLLLLLLIVPVIGLSQYTKKELKKLDKMELKIVNRGLDLNSTFVVYSEESSQQLIDLVEDSWETAMFSKGLDVGDYYEESQVKDTNNREMALSNSITFNGRYVFDTSTRGQIKIQDLENNNKLVASITYKRDLSWGVGFNPLIWKKEYVIEELMKSNR
jgi:hypothetical protein